MSGQEADKNCLNFYQRSEPVLSKPSIKYRPLKIVLYSHDTMGLGHKRRNILIAQTLAACHLPTEIMMITGTQIASDFAKLPSVDCLSLPELYKTSDGFYQSKNWDCSLKKITKLRSKIIKAAIVAFKPDVLIADNVPRGAAKELNPTLKYLRSRQSTYCILGLRDVLDRPEAVTRDWNRAQNEKAIRKYYQEVWVYGDAAIYDLRREYHFSSNLTAKIHYLGYLDQRPRLQFEQSDSEELLTNLGLSSGKLVLCLLGGGQDGAKLAQAFAHAHLPQNTNGVIVTGPFMPSEERQKLHYYAAQKSHLRVIDYLPEPTLLLQQADSVIGMGGYNTICEVLSFAKRALIVPRIKPRLEQLIRAERLQNLGLLDMLHPDQVNSQTLTEWLAQEEKPLNIRDQVDLNGCDRLVKLLEHRYFINN